MTGYSFIPIEALSPDSHSVRGIACLIAHKLQDARFNGEMTGTLEEIGSWLSVPENELQPILDSLRLNDDLTVSRKGNRVSIRSTKVRTQCERKERKRAQDRLRIREKRNRKKLDASSEAIRDEETGNRETAPSVACDTLKNQEQEPVCAVQNRFTVHEDDNVVVVVVVSYKNKQQLQPPAPGGDSSVEAGPSTPPVPPANPGSPSNGIPTTACPVQMPFVPFPGVTLPPMQLVMGGILPDMPKPQVIVDNTKSPLEKGIDELINLLPGSLRTPECRSMIEKLHADKGFGYLKAQIKYVLDMEYQGEKGFRGYLRKAVRKNFAEYREPVQCAPAGPAKSSSEEESRRINDRRIQQAAVDTLERMKDNPSMKDQLRALERAALDRFPKCDKTGFLPMAMRQIIVECLERQAGINHELMIKEGAG